MCEYIFKYYYDLIFVECKEGWNVIFYVVKNGNIKILKFF